MKRILTGIAIMTIATSSALACNFQGASETFISSKKIKCNDKNEVATIISPKIEIDGKKYNITGSWNEVREYWDTSTSNYNSRNEVSTTVKRKRKKRKIPKNLTSRAANEICRDFGFSRQVGTFKTSAIFSYFKKAYSYDHGKAFQQSLNHAPIKEIKCR